MILVTPAPATSTTGTRTAHDDRETETTEAEARTGETEPGGEAGHESAAESGGSETRETRKEMTTPQPIECPVCHGEYYDLDRHLRDVSGIAGHAILAPPAAPAIVPLPGDFAVVSAGGLAGPLVGWAERTLLAAGPYAQYEHAFIYVGEQFAREQMQEANMDSRASEPHEIIQAEPTGTSWAALTPHGHTLWSTGKIPLTDVQRINIVRCAILYLGTPYSFLDYLAIALHQWHIPAPGLRNFIGDTKSMICSQLCDRVYADAGVHLFTDPPRWPGYVAPSDLARLLETP